jgi:hypothetical protein
LDARQRQRIADAIRRARESHYGDDQFRDAVNGWIEKAIPLSNSGQRVPASQQDTPQHQSDLSRLAEISEAAEVQARSVMLDHLHQLNAVKSTLADAVYAEIADFNFDEPRDTRIILRALKGASLPGLPPRVLLHLAEEATSYRNTHVRTFLAEMLG